MTLQLGASPAVCLPIRGELSAHCCWLPTSLGPTTWVKPGFSSFPGGDQGSPSFGKRGCQVGTTLALSNLPQTYSHCFDLFYIWRVSARFQWKGTSAKDYNPDLIKSTWNMRHFNKCGYSCDNTSHLQVQEKVCVCSGWRQGRGFSGRLL